MAKENKPQAQKSGSGTRSNSAKPAGATKPEKGATAASTTSGGQFIANVSTPPRTNKGKQGAGGRGGREGTKPRVGGSAVQGAKSTRPKELTEASPQQQEAESYNREMRRRMEHLGTGPGQGSTMQDKQRKRREKRKQRIEERRQEVKKLAAKGPRNIVLGRRNTYFLIAVAIIIIAVIAIAIIINHPF